jgi:tetratricopeptide (TPR) repeat protein
MAKVPLRKYNSEIETLIDRGQTDEAIAHCRHILKTFPKHLETYRLLGKAYLEAKRYTEATDIFERVLMAVPDDFVSHVGMSIIADDQKRLDDAIWHMERAFEKQPSNAAIQAELQRLYGRRDGMEPPKIRLTRGALAHMYLQGDLHTQAAAEIRSVLAGEPNRADMQALLALAYFRGGQKVDASDICSQLLERHPYCLDANRILVEILPGTGMAENTQVYRQRVTELDPYTAFTPGSIFLTSETPDTKVSLERLDYKGQPVAAPPAWDSALGAAAASNAQPDWMKAPAKEEPAPPVSSPFDFASRSASEGQDKPFDSAQESPFDFPKADAASQDRPFDDIFGGATPEPAAPASGGETIPEWMRDAGWGASSGAFTESAQSFDVETSATDLPKADLPDWIKSMAPVESETPVVVAPAALVNEDTMDWLNKLSGDKPFNNALPGTPEGQDKVFDDALPGTSEEQDKPFDDALPGIPDGHDKPAQEAFAADAIPDWLSDFDKPLDATSRSTPDGQDKPAQEVPAAPAAATLDWLSDFDKPLDAASRSTPEEQDKPAQEVPVAPAAATLDWLSDFDKLLDAAPRSAPEEQDQPFAEPAQETPLAVASPVEPAPAPVSPDAGIGNLGTSVAEQDAAMLWLESLAAKQGAKSEELITNPEERLEKPPEWVEQAKIAGEAQLAAPAPMEEEPHPSRFIWNEKELAEIPPSEPATADQTGVWLRELDEKDEAPAPIVEAEPAAWPSVIEFAPPPAGPLAESAPEADLPTWLRGLEAREAASAAASASDDMPDWLKGEEREVPAPPEPTRPADWTPEAVKVAAPPAPEPEPRKKPAPKPEASAPAEMPKVTRTGMLPPVIDPNLSSARDALSHGKIPDALHSYGNLIRKGKLLEDIIFDLKEALYRFPVEVSIWQALGDAYMRANRLQDALDAYTKAEELIR